MGFSWFWLTMADKEIKVHRPEIRMVFPMIQRVKNNRSVWRALPVYDKVWTLQLRNWEFYSHFWDIFSSKIGKKNTLFWIWEAADIRPQIRPRKVPANTNEPPYDKTNKMILCPAKTKISRGIHPGWSVFAVRQWVAKQPSFLHADSENWSDWPDVQADLSPRWAHMPFCWFCHEAAQMYTPLLFLPDFTKI